MKLNKKQIGKRMKIFGLSKFDNLKDFAKAVETSPTTLSGTYFNGRSLPGGKLIAHLILHGCDVNWLFFGEKNKQPNNDIINQKLNILFDICQGIQGEIKGKRNGISKKAK